MPKIVKNGEIEMSDVEAASRRGQALQMRVACMTYPQIGQALGIAKQTAWALVQSELKKIQEPRKIDVIGGTIVKSLEPLAEEFIAILMFALFKVHVGYRMGGNCVAGIQIQGPAGQYHGLIQISIFMMGKGV